MVKEIDGEFDRIEERISVVDALKVLRKGNVIEAGKKKFTFETGEDGLTQSALYRIAEENGISQTSIDAAYSVINVSKDEVEQNSALDLHPSKDVVMNAYDQTLLDCLKEKNPGTQFARGIWSSNTRKLNGWYRGCDSNDYFNVSMNGHFFYELHPFGSRTSLVLRREESFWTVTKHASLKFHGREAHIKIMTPKFTMDCEEAILGLKEKFPDYQQNIIQDF